MQPRQDLRMLYILAVICDNELQFDFVIFSAFCFLSVNIYRWSTCKYIYEKIELFKNASSKYDIHTM